MSWDIYIYAEYKHSGSEAWKPLCEHPILDCYKLYNDGFIDYLKSMKGIDSCIDEIKSNHADSMLKFCKIDEFVNHYRSIINQINIKLRSAYLALDLGVTIDYDDIYVEQDFTDCNESNDVNRMTNPVSKRLMTDLANSFNDLSKAHEMIGLSNVLSSMTQYNDIIRLIFVTM